MSKPIRSVEIKTAAGRKASLAAVFDTGSFYTIIREDCLPAGTKPEKFKRAKIFGTARARAKISIIGEIGLEIRVEGHWINGLAYVTPHLSSDMLIGAGEMQRWDISVKNKNGHTKIHVGHDMNDPDIQEID